MPRLSSVSHPCLMCAICPICSQSAFYMRSICILSILSVLLVSLFYAHLILIFVEVFKALAESRIVAFPINLSNYKGGIEEEYVTCTLPFTIAARTTVPCQYSIPYLTYFYNKIYVIAVGTKYDERGHPAPTSSPFLGRRGAIIHQHRKDRAEECSTISRPFSNDPSRRCEYTCRMILCYLFIFLYLKSGVLTLLLHRQ
jgi:hypothetical protein